MATTPTCATQSGAGALTETNGSIGKAGAGPDVTRGTICATCGRISARPGECVQCRIGRRKRDNSRELAARYHHAIESERVMCANWRESEIRRYFRQLLHPDIKPGMKVIIQPAYRRDISVIKSHIQVAAGRLHWRISWSHKTGSIQGRIELLTRRPEPPIPNWYEVNRV